jgi:4-carboxymuconolactone decarboxylase
MISKLTVAIATLGAAFGALPSAAQPASSASAATADRVLPPDIDSESLSRLPALRREDLDAEGQRIWDYVVGDGPRPLTGPVAVSMHSPKVAEAFQMLNQYLRNGSILEPRDYEVVIMQAAWEFEQAYEWSAHEGGARRFGVPENVIETVKFDREPEGLSERDTMLIRFARALLRDHEIDSELYADIVAEFGRQGMVELATIIGDYVMVGFVLTAADQHLPPNMQNTLPER